MVMSIFYLLTHSFIISLTHALNSGYIHMLLTHTPSHHISHTRLELFYCTPLPISMITT